jgi:hypothetical protein
VPGYAPVIPGSTISFTAAGWIDAGDPVELDRPNTVRRADGTGVCVGIAGNAAEVDGTVTVHIIAPVHEAPAEGDVAVGDMLRASVVMGRQVAVVTDPVNDQAIGVALTGAADREAPARRAPPARPALPGRPPSSSATSASSPPHCPRTGSSWRAPWRPATRTPTTRWSSGRA